MGLVSGGRVKTRIIVRQTFIYRAALFEQCLPYSFTFVFGLHGHNLQRLRHTVYWNYLDSMSVRRGCDVRAWNLDLAKSKPNRNRMIKVKEEKCDLNEKYERLQVLDTLSPNYRAEISFLQLLLLTFVIIWSESGLRGIFLVRDSKFYWLNPSWTDSQEWQWLPFSKS